MNRKFYQKLDHPYSKCVINKSSINSFDSDLYRTTIKMAGVYSKVYCSKLCVGLNLSWLIFKSYKINIYL